MLETAVVSAIQGYVGTKDGIPKVVQGAIFRSPSCREVGGSAIPTLTGGEMVDGTY